MNLNEQQQAVVNHINGPALVTACPGSGKTASITARTANLIKNGHTKILCITFTNKAAAQMKQRILHAVGADKLAGVYIGTFHAFCAILLRNLGKHIGYTKRMSILDQDDQQTLIKKIARQIIGQKDDQILQQLKINMSRLIYNIDDTRQLAQSISDREQRFGNAFENNSDIYLRICNKYIQTLPLMNAVDFCGLQTQTVRLFQNFPQALKLAQNKFTHIQVDEVQDTSVSQFKLIRMLAQSHKNLVLCGDIDQSIFAFRKARVQNVMDFKNDYPGTKILPLGKNYRSTPQILKPARKLIQLNTNRIDSGLQTDNKSGQPVKVMLFENPQQQARSIASNIKYLIQQQGYSGHDFAIIYRLNALSMQLQMAMNEIGVKYKVIGGGNFFQLKQIKDIVSMLKFATNHKDTIAFHRCAGLFSGVGDATIGVLESISQSNKMDVYQAAVMVADGRIAVKPKVLGFAKNIVATWSIFHEGKSICDVINHFLNQFQYESYLLKHYKEDTKKKLDNIKALLDNAAYFENVRGGDLVKWLNNIMLASESDKQSQNDSVNLITAHASKGLQYPVVFMIGMEQNTFPHGRALQQAVDPIKAVQEQRRLCYVAMTRAKKSLRITLNKVRFKRDNKGILKPVKMKPSQFLYESGLIEQEGQNANS